MMADVDMLHVPYRGAAPALTDLLGGRAQVMFEGVLSLTEHIRTGRLRPLAVTTTVRSPVLADVPTVGEFLPGYEASVWFEIGALKATSAEIVDRLNKEINAGLADPKLRARLSELGGTALAVSPAEFGKLFAEDTDKWGKVVRAANIKLGVEQQEGWFGMPLRCLANIFSVGCSATVGSEPESFCPGGALRRLALYDDGMTRERKFSARWHGARPPCLPRRRAWSFKRGWHISHGHSPLGLGRVAQVRCPRTGRRRWGVAICRSPRQWPLTENSTANTTLGSWRRAD